MPGRPRVVHTPGHTAGNVALSLADREVLVVGGTLATLSLSHGDSGPQLLPRFLNEDHDRALASLEKIEPVKARSVLPGHGLPWEGSRQQAVKLARQIAARPRLRPPRDSVPRRAAPCCVRPGSLTEPVPGRPSGGPGAAWAEVLAAMVPLILAVILPNLA